MNGYPNRFKGIFEMKDIYGMVVTDEEIEENREYEEYLRATEGEK